jgi:ankyrin repeat protein
LSVIAYNLSNRALLCGLVLGFSFLTPRAVPQPQTGRASPTRTGGADNIELFYAAKDNDIQKARSLIAAGANVNARAGVSYGPDHPSPYANLTPLHVAASNNSKDVASLLLDRGADPNARDLGGETPLHLAARLRDTSIALLLLSRGADVNARDSDGYTPLMKAAGEFSDEGMVTLLVSRGANVNAKNGTGETALFVATLNTESSSVEFLLAHGADPNAQTDRGETALSVATKRKYDDISALLRSHGAKLSNIPSYADLEDAADAGDAARLQDLLANVPDRNLVNWRNENGAGLLWGAAAQNRPEVVKLLLENGADPNLATNSGETPLHEAASHMAGSPAAEQEKAVEIATMLLEKGANVNAKTRDGVTPLTFARVNEQHKMIDLLQQHGGRE